MNPATKTHEVKVYTGLPPMVSGDTRGVLHLKFPLLKWDCSTPPPAPRLCVFLKWWGEKTEGCVFRVPIEYNQKLHPSIQPSFAWYPILSNWKHFKSYLEDMGHLKVLVGLGRTPDDLLIMGECVIPHLASITPEKPERRTSTVVTDDGKVHLGRLNIEILVKMNASRHVSSSVPTCHPAGAKVDVSAGHRTKPKPFSSFNNQAPPTKPSQSVPVHVITVPANSKEWKPVKRVKFSSGPNQTDSIDKSVQVPLGTVAKQMVSNLLERARTLHEDMVCAISNDSRDEERNQTPDNKEKIGSVKMPITINIPEGFATDSTYEATPPMSPTESMLEMEANLCISTPEEKDDIEVGTVCENKSTKERIGPCIDSVQYLQSQNQNETLPQSGAESNAACAKLSPLNRSFPSPEVDTTKDKNIFHLLLEIAEGSGIFNPSDPVRPPNVYVQCRLFCSETPLQTKVFFGTREPKIGIKQVFPIYMGWNNLLKCLDGGYAVIEVWDKTQEFTQEEATEDESTGNESAELIGLVKVSLQSFYLAVWSSLHTPAYETSLFPVVAVDSYCPVKDPFTGKTCGYLAVRLMMGTPANIPAKMGLGCMGSYGIHDTVEPPKGEADDSDDSMVEKTSELIDEKVAAERIEDVRREETSEEEEGVEPIREEEEEEVLPSSHEPLHTESTKEQSSSEADCFHKDQKDMLELELLISQAFHLPLLTSPLETSCSVPRAYVTCHPHPSVGKVTTHVSMETTKPRWEYQCTVSIPYSFMDAAMCELEFQLWSLPPDTHQETRTISNDPAPKTHIFLGRAFVDLVPLQYGLRNLVGWYNVVDLAGELHGQLKIAITPKDRIPPRREQQSNHFFQSRSLLPVQIGLYSSEISSSTSVCDKTIIEQPQLTGNDEPSGRSLSLLRKQLQSHVADLESIQKSLEAKLKDTPTSDTPFSMHNSTSSPKVETHPLLTSVSQGDGGTSDTDIAANSPGSCNGNYMDSLTPVKSHDESIYPTTRTTSPCCYPEVNTTTPSPIELLKPHTTSSPLTGNVVTEITEVDDGSLEESLESSTDKAFEDPDGTSEKDTVSLSQSILINKGEGLVQTNRTPQKNSVLLPQSNIINEGEGLVQNSTAQCLVNQTATENGDDDELEMKHFDNRSNLEECVNVVDGTQEAKESMINKQEPSSEKFILTEIDGNQKSSSQSPANEVGMTLSASVPLTAVSTEESKEVEMVNESSSTTSETSPCSFDITRKMEVLKRQEQDINREDSDTSVLEDIDLISRPMALPSCDEEDLEEEAEEVKRLFNRLLKERDHSYHSQYFLSGSTEGSNDSSSPSNADTDVESESDHDSDVDDPDQIKAVPASMQQRKTLSDDHLPSYFLPENKLAEKLLALRRSALSKLPPRPLQQTNHGTNPQLRVDLSPQQNPLVKRLNPPQIKTPERERLRRIFHS